MNAIVLRVLLLFGGLSLAIAASCCCIGCRKSPTSVSKNNTSSLCVIEVRRGGGRQPEPHPIWISIYNDGLIRNQYGEHRVDAENVEQLLQQIIATSLFNINQNQFDAKLREASELNKSVRGGSGVYTISIELDGKMQSLRLNQPELYANSAVIPARKFLDVLTMIKSFAAQQ